jgi:hypothetical protein
MDQKLEQLTLSQEEREALPTSLHAIFVKPVGTVLNAERRRFELGKYGGTKVLNLSGSKPISKIELE